MKKVSRIILLLSLSAVLLSGCAGQASVRSSTSNLASKTGAGILQLEGRDLAVSAEQAAAMLPLWQALLTLSADSNTAPAEISALNDQIMETLTQEQLDTIAGMDWDEAELSSLTGGEDLSTVQSLDTEGGVPSNSTGQPAGDMPGGAPPAGGGEMAAISVAEGGEMFTSSANLPGQSEREAAGGVNLTVAPAVIELLRSKIARA